MTITIRKIKTGDARALLEVHHAAVREIASSLYPDSIIDVWARVPITAEDISDFIANPDDEVRVVAEIEGEIVGIASLVLEENELRACYVAPHAIRKGVGTALVEALERVALHHGLTYLWTHASINAEPFYLSIGFEGKGRGEHQLRSGQEMACVKMEKMLHSQETGGR